MATPASLRFQPFTTRHAREMLSWHYEPPYDLYNLPGPASPATVESFLQPENPYLAVLDEHDRMIAFRCFGEEARVPGGDYSTPSALDIGGGLRPDLTGRGLGRHIIAAAMNYGRDRFSPRHFRTTVASFNLRAKKTCERLGYHVASTFVRPQDGLEFVVLMQAAREMDLAIPVR